MTGLATLRCPGEFSSAGFADSRSDTSEYFSPDILHVFQDDQDPISRANMAHQDHPSSFTHFSRLPIEVRYLIWEAAVPDPATVPRTWNSPFGYSLRRKVPAVLHACPESRRLLTAPAKGSYAASCPKYQLVQRPGRYDEGVYLNWRAESIWIHRGCKGSLPRVERAS